MKLKNKICIVTGSSSGIGASIAEAYSKEKGKVIITYYSGKLRAHKIAKKIGAVAVFKLDVRKKNSIASVFKSVKKKFGRIDVLVNNAGINKTADFDKLKEKDWDQVLDVNLKGVFLCCQEVLKYISNKGKIINIGSLSGEYGGPRTPSYAAAKSGVMSLTHCLARFVGKKNICVNCLSPGVIENRFTKKTMSKSVRKTASQLLLLPRFGRLEDLIGTAVYLASSDSDYVTGQTISVNGGAWVR